MPLSFVISDSIFNQKDNDSLLISYQVLTKLIPDTVLSKVFGKGVKPKLYAVGKIVVPKKENYLVVKAYTAAKKVVYVIVYNDANQFVTAMPALLKDQLASTHQEFSIDKNLAIIKTVTRKNKDGSVSEGKDVYALDEAEKKIKLVMTDPLDDKITELINPIDTLPRKNKMSADYGSDKMNLVSIRDNKKKNRLTFFIHFEKNNGECTGELKGEAVLLKTDIAEYRENGDPCILQFIFSSNAVTLKEIDGCGSRRGLNCSFDGTFRKRKPVKSAKK
jgi:hypothetical protein